MDVHTVAKALLVLLAGYVVKFLTTFYKKRRALNGLVRYMGPAPERCTDSLQPQPPFSFAFGHLLIISKLVSTLPANCHPHVLTYYIRKNMTCLQSSIWKCGPSAILFALSLIQTSHTKSRCRDPCQSIKLLVT